MLDGLMHESHFDQNLNENKGLPAYQVLLPVAQRVGRYGNQLIIMLS